MSKSGGLAKPPALSPQGLQQDSDYGDPFQIFDDVPLKPDLGVKKQGVLDDLKGTKPKFYPAKFQANNWTPNPRMTKEIQRSEYVPKESKKLQADYASDDNQFKIRSVNDLMRYDPAPRVPIPTHTSTPLKPSQQNLPKDNQGLGGRVDPPLPSKPKDIQGVGGGGYLKLPPKPQKQLGQSQKPKLVDHGGVPPTDMGPPVCPTKQGHAIAWRCNVDYVPGFYISSNSAAHGTHVDYLDVDAYLAAEPCQEARARLNMLPASEYFLRKELRYVMNVKVAELSRCRMFKDLEGDQQRLVVDRLVTAILKACPSLERLELEKLDRRVTAYVCEMLQLEFVFTASQMDSDTSSFGVQPQTTVGQGGSPIKVVGGKPVPEPVVDDKTAKKQHNEKSKRDRRSVGFSVPNPVLPSNLRNINEKDNDSSDSSKDNQQGIIEETQLLRAQIAKATQLVEQQLSKIPPVSTEMDNELYTTIPIRTLTIMRSELEGVRKELAAVREQTALFSDTGFRGKGMIDNPPDPRESFIAGGPQNEGLKRDIPVPNKPDVKIDKINDKGVVGEDTLKELRELLAQGGTGCSNLSTDQIRIAAALVDKLDKQQKECEQRIKLAADAEQAMTRTYRRIRHKMEDSKDSDFENDPVGASNRLMVNMTRNADREELKDNLIYRMKTLPVFTGKQGTVKWEKWKEYFDAYVIRYGLTEDDKLTWINKKVSGAAAEVLNDAIVDADIEGVTVTATFILNALDDYYFNAAKRRTMDIKLNQMKMGDSLYCFANIAWKKCRCRYAGRLQQAIAKWWEIIDREVKDRKDYYIFLQAKQGENPVSLLRILRDLEPNLEESKEEAEEAALFAPEGETEVYREGDQIQENSLTSKQMQGAEQVFLTWESYYDSGKENTLQTTDLIYAVTGTFRPRTAPETPEYQKWLYDLRMDVTNLLGRRFQELKRNKKITFLKDVPTKKFQDFLRWYSRMHHSMISALTQMTRDMEARTEQSRQPRQQYGDQRNTRARSSDTNPSQDVSNVPTVSGNSQKRADKKSRLNCVTCDRRYKPLGNICPQGKEHLCSECFLRSNLRELFNSEKGDCTFCVKGVKTFTAFAALCRVAMEQKNAQ